jgi:hypothetical protein
LLTVAGRVSSRSATAWLLSPSAIARITSARNAMRCSVFPALSQPLKVARCSSVKTTSAALITADYHVRQITQLGTKIQPGDVIVSVDQKLVTTPESAATQLKEAAAQGNVLLLLNRHGMSQFVGLSVENNGTAGSSR